MSRDERITMPCGFLYLENKATLLNIFFWIPMLSLTKLVVKTNELRTWLKELSQVIGTPIENSYRQFSIKENKSLLMKWKRIFHQTLIQKTNDKSKEDNRIYMKKLKQMKMKKKDSHFMTMFQMKTLRQNLEKRLTIILEWYLDYEQLLDWSHYNGDIKTKP